MGENRALKRLYAIDKEIVLLSHILGVLSWDQEVLPPAAIEERGAQMGLLERRIHSLETSDEMGELLAALESVELDEIDGALVREAKRTFLREKKLSGEFVQLFSETTTRAYSAWVNARREDNFAEFVPVLESIVALLKEKSAALGHTGEPYDPLLDIYEPAMRTVEVEQLFAQMKQDLLFILDSLDTQPIEDTFLYGKFPREGQEFFIKEVLSSMGFDWDRGLLGTANHPATTSLGSDDIRITTRYEELSVASPLFSAIHEGGHALYEMACSSGRIKGTRLANGASLAFHESQSRLWENMVGRSSDFWDYFYPRFKELFPLQLANVDKKAFVAAINKVEPSPIRVDADEVTYGLHIILRFELEKALLGGSLEVKDLSEAWNTRMEELLHIKIKSNRSGVLQDIHWSMGAFGYFPTYALGNLYAAQIFAKMRGELDIPALLRGGDFVPIREWLQAKILNHGMVYTPKELIQRVSDSPLKSTYYRDYLTKKYLER